MLNRSYTHRYGLGNPHEACGAIITINYGCPSKMSLRFPYSLGWSLLEFVWLPQLENTGTLRKGEQTVIDEIYDHQRGYLLNPVLIRAGEHIMCREHDPLLETWLKGFSRQLGHGNPMFDFNIERGIVHGKHTKQIDRLA